MVENVRKQKGYNYGELLQSIIVISINKLKYVTYIRYMYLIHYIHVFKIYIIYMYLIFVLLKFIPGCKKRQRVRNIIGSFTHCLDYHIFDLS